MSQSHLKAIVDLTQAQGFGGPTGCQKKLLTKGEVSRVNRMMDAETASGRAQESLCLPITGAMSAATVDQRLDSSLDTLIAQADGTSNNKRQRAGE